MKIIFWLVLLFFCINLEGYLKTIHRKWHQFRTKLEDAAECVLVGIWFMFILWWIPNGDQMLSSLDIKKEVLVYILIPAVVSLLALANGLWWDRKEKPIEDYLDDIWRRKPKTTNTHRIDK